jgi:8-oxoguanine deaminase
MASLLLKNADIIVCMDDAGRELQTSSIYCRDGMIEAVGTADDLPDSADQVIDLTGKIVIPGLINTHHHLFQNLTRVLPAAQNATLFGWLTSLYPIWQNLRPDHIASAVSVGLAELALSGCTTSSDHQYLYPNGARLDESIEAAQQLGMRFVATRGSMSIGVSKGGLPPDSLVEDEAAILKDCERVVHAYHDPKKGAMIQVALAPCSPFSVSVGLMRETAEMARQLGVGLHTHLAENEEDIDYSLAHFGMRPGEYAQSVGWVGEDVWHAHCVKLNTAEQQLFARTGTGIAHCPCSNMRLASGIAPLRQMLDIGVPVGLGVDGSSSNDSGHMLAEARQAMLLQRVGGNPAALNAREALRLATRGGAEVLNRRDIGQISPGHAADMAVYDRDTIDLSGTWTDPVAALIFCGPVKTRHTIIHGKLVVEDGQLVSLDLPALLERHKQSALSLLAS